MVEIQFVFGPGKEQVVVLGVGGCRGLQGGATTTTNSSNRGSPKTLEDPKSTKNILPLLLGSTRKYPKV